jgi:hypothetical protein
LPRGTFLNCFRSEVSELADSLLNSGVELVLDGRREASNRCDGQHNLTTATDAMNGRIVDVKVVEKQMGPAHRDFFGPSNAMNVDRIRQLALRWRDNPLDKAKVPL